MPKWPVEGVAILRTLDFSSNDPTRPMKGTGLSEAFEPCWKVKLPADAPNAEHFCDAIRLVRFKSHSKTFDEENSSSALSGFTLQVRVFFQAPINFQRDSRNFLTICRLQPQLGQIVLR